MAIDKEKVLENVKAGLIFAKEKAEVATDKAIELAQEGGERLNQAKVELDRKLLNPITISEFEEVAVKSPKIIRLLETNPHAGKEACENAIGFNSTIVKTKVLELVKGEFPEDRFTFYPNQSELIYLRNPYVENMYLSLNSYFEYIKKARIAELENIANSLGAKYVKVTYKEEEKKFVSVAREENFGVKLPKGKAKEEPSAKEEFSLSSKQLVELEIASENVFAGHNNPVRPELVYFKGDLTIEGLINAVMGDNPTKEKKFTLKYNRNTDLSLDAAEGIDAVLGKLKIKASASVKSEVENENRLYLGYEIQL